MSPVFVLAIPAMIMFFVANAARSIGGFAGEVFFVLTLIVLVGLLAELAWELLPHQRPTSIPVVVRAPRRISVREVFEKEMEERYGR